MRPRRHGEGESVTGGGHAGHMWGSVRVPKGYSPLQLEQQKSHVLGVPLRRRSVCIHRRSSRSSRGLSRSRTFLPRYLDEVRMAARGLGGTASVANGRSVRRKVGSGVPSRRTVQASRDFKFAIDRGKCLLCRRFVLFKGERRVSPIVWWLLHGLTPWLRVSQAAPSLMCLRRCQASQATQYASCSPLTRRTMTTPRARVSAESWKSTRETAFHAGPRCLPLASSGSGWALQLLLMPYLSEKGKQVGCVSLRALEMCYRLGRR